MMGEIKRYNSIGDMEWAEAGVTLQYPLSGYLAGKPRGGTMVRALEDLWCETFGVKHAIACNSCTSALHAAADAVQLWHNERFICSPMTMSATAAAPAQTGARPMFFDVDPETFSLWPGMTTNPLVKAVFTTNLFGHPSHLTMWRAMCDKAGYYLIEDNAQSPFAMENNRYAGTIGHIGCWSLNVHKHFQCGEGGIATTNDDDLADRLRAFVNHGENVQRGPGLNLRMPEICAAIALSQLRRGRTLVQNRVEQAEAILDEIGRIPGLRMPYKRPSCTHVYYVIPFVIESNRTDFCDELRDAGVPVTEGYVEPLYRLPAFEDCWRGGQTAAKLHDETLFYIENCAWTFSDDQIKLIGDAFKCAAEKVLCP
jgi:perosamine synthetase